MIALGLALLVACGRLGFDAQPDATADATPLAPVDPIDLAVPLFTTTSTAFVDIPGGMAVVPPSPGRRWLLLARATLGATPAGEASVEIRYLVDGIERGLGGTDSGPGAPGPWQHLWLFEGSAAPTTITLQLREARGGTAEVTDLRVIVVPLPAEDAVAYASADAPTPVTATTLTPTVNLDLDVPVAGTYLVALLVVGNEAPAASDVFWQWLDPDGQPWGREMQNPRQTWQSWLHVRPALLPAGATRLTLLTRTNSAATVRDVRAVALRFDALSDRIAFKLSTQGPSTTGTAPLDVNTFAPAATLAPGLRGYVVLGTHDINDTCTPAAGERGAYVRIDGTARTTVHLPGSCALDATYGLLDLRAAPPVEVAAGISSANGVEVLSRGSALVVLGVP